ncbi:TctA family transporter [Devosia enhydra]|uniref:TctA family transporter n=1 Tax=Devosia enhydra TaxID=665118 RepID=A0A1K2HU01_9HYPH|nr:tripartite tricarboxylate transporter permease [Devosia enhydra]SFZ81424.1 TctA family transporter [Devosia enhydra]
MDMLIQGFSVAFSPDNLFYCLVGVFLGTLVGVLPGVGTLASISLLLPMTFYLDPTTALIMLAGVYYGSEYGGSTASILLNLPGSPSNAVTCLDGYPMAQQGRAGVALFMTSIASFVGGSIGILLMMGFSPLLVKIAFSFGPAEYFALMVLGLLAATAIAQGSPLKGIAMVVVGMLIGCVGMDISSGIPRFTFGNMALFEGVNMVILAMGLFGVSEIFASANQLTARLTAKDITLRSMLPTREDWRRSAPSIFRGSGIGSIIGALPGTGATIAAYLSYTVEKQVSKNRRQLGTGAIEGISAPEAANNAAVQTAFIPTLTMGIPGSASMALILGALMMHGIYAGPSTMTDHPDMFWGLIASFWIGNVLLLLLNIPLVGIWVRLLALPYRYIFPAVIIFICVGVYSLTYSFTDVVLVLGFGLLGYGLKLAGYEPAPLLIGFILGPLIEEYLRRAMLLARGDFLTILQRPISGSMLLVCALLLGWALYVTWRRYRPGAPEPLPTPAE